MEILRNLGNWIIEIINFLILVRIVLSFVPNGYNNQIGHLVYQITEPILAPIRRILPNTGMIDFSPLILFFILSFIRTVINS